MAVIQNNKTIYLPDNTGGLMVQVDNATPVDNIFVFSSGGYTFKWTPNFNGEYYLSQAIILAGDATDKTALFQAILNNANIRSVVLDAQQAITISGTLNVPNGKIIRFTNGASFTGSGTIDNMTIDADLGFNIFGTSLIITSAKTVGNLVSVKWWGATGDGVTNDQPSIQRAADVIIANPKLPRTLYFQPGLIYKITTPLIFYKWTGTDYAFFTLNLLGQDSAYFNGTSTEAIIDATSITDTFAIGYQLARSSLIKGLVIRGAFNPSFASYSAYVSTDYSTWASMWGVRDTRWSPYAGICLDPFDNTGSLPMIERYPGLESLYRGSGANVVSGSSGIRVAECRIYGFTVDIMISPNGYTQNAENTHIIDCTLEIAKVAYASGQDQTKDNFIIRAISWERVHTLIDTISYGQLIGQPAFVDGWNVAGDVIEIYQLSAPRSQVSFKNIFAESLWRIGTGNGGTGITIQDGSFNFNENTVPVIYPPTHLEGNLVVFRNCVIKYYDNLFNKSIRVKGYGFVFQDCQFDMPPLLDFPYNNEKIVSATFRNCNTALGYLTDVAGGNGQFSSAASAPYVAYGNIQLGDGGLLSGSGYNYIENVNIKLQYPGSYQRAIRIGTNTLTVNNSLRTGVLTGLLGTNIEFQIAIGDYLIDESGNVFGRVTSFNRTLGTAVIEEIPVNITGVRVENFVLCYVETGYGQFIGNVTSGSATLSQCEFDNLLPPLYVGQRLKIGHSTLRLIVDSINTGAGTITMSKVADYTATKQFNGWINNSPATTTLELQSLYTPQELLSSSTWPVLIPIGAKLLTKKNGVSAANGEAYVCTVPGYMSAVTLTKNNQAKFAKIVAAYSDTYTPTLTGVANVTSSTPRLSFANVVNNIVSIAGELDVVPVAGSTLTKVGISLYLSSDLTNSYDLDGGGSKGAIITADTTNNRAELSFTSSGTTTETLKFWLTYIVI